MKKIYLITLLMVILVSGCAGNNNNPTGNSISQEIEIKGSDTLLQSVSNLAEAYTKNNPKARISVTGGGSGTGIAALINGEIDIADASRPIKEKEVQQAKERSIEPWEFIIARDTLSVIVHNNNPVTKLTKDEIGSIYSGKITNWKEVGGNDQKITLYGRQSTSGTYAYFMENIVKDDYSPHMRNMEGNQAILDAVKQDRTSIGYVGIGYILTSKGTPVPGIKIISIAEKQGTPYISPQDGNSQYPISRALYQYFSGKPEKNSAIHNFLLFELSADGQEIVKRSGFFSITANDKKQNDNLLKKI